MAEQRRAVLTLKARRAISGRLRKFIYDHWDNPNQVSLRFRIPHATLNGWLNSKSPSLPSAEHLIRLSAETSLSLDWLLTGEGSPLKGGSTSEDLGQRLRAQVHAELRVRGYSDDLANRIIPGEEFLTRSVLKLMVGHSLRLARFFAKTKILPGDMPTLPHHRLPDRLTEEFGLAPDEFLTFEPEE